MTDFLGFNPHDYVAKIKSHEEKYSPIPKGKYDCKVIHAGEHVSKAGNRMIKLELEVVGPTHSGRRLWEYFGIWGDAQYNDIHRQKFTAFLSSIGCLNAASMAEYRSKKVNCYIAVEGDSNKIVSYSAIEIKKISGDDDLPF